MFEKIVVGVDGHDGGRDALALTAVLAGLWSADVVAVRAHPHGCPEPALAHLDALLQRDAEVALSADIARAGLAAAPRVTADRSAAAALHRTAVTEDADLIVVGSTGHGPAGHMAGGDVPAATLRGAPCAVAVTPRGWRSAPAMPDSIAVGVGEERDTEAALRCAIALTQRTGGSLTLLCVVALPGDLEVDGAFVEEVGERYRAGNDALARRISEEHDVVASGLTVIGRPAEELIELSGAVDLLVVGSQRSGRTGRPEIGRTTDRLVRGAGCPVLVVPPEGPGVPAARRHAGTAMRGTRAIDAAVGAVS